MVFQIIAVSYELIRMGMFSCLGHCKNLGNQPRWRRLGKPAVVLHCSCCTVRELGFYDVQFQLASASPRNLLGKFLGITSELATPGQLARPLDGADKHLLDLMN